MSDTKNFPVYLITNDERELEDGYACHENTLADARRCAEDMANDFANDYDEDCTCTIFLLTPLESHVVQRGTSIVKHAMPQTLAEIASREAAALRAKRGW